MPTSRPVPLTQPAEHQVHAPPRSNLEAISPEAGKALRLPSQTSHDEVVKDGRNYLAAMIAEPALLMAQRLALTAQISKTLGNQYLASVVARVDSSSQLAVQRQPETERVKKLNKDYEDAIKGTQPNWQAAAEYLNAFNREDICSRLEKRSVDEIASLHQGALDNAKVGPQSAIALLTPVLLTEFARKFRSAAELIRQAPEAMDLIKEAEDAKVKFGGYAEDGPSKDSWPYTIGDTVYIPKGRDKVQAMSDFVFELNNAIRQPKIRKLEEEAAKGSKGNLTAEQYATQKVEVEVEGMLRAGEIWFDTKGKLGKGNWGKYDADFFLGEYEAFKSGKKTKADIVKKVLGSKYTTGVDKGKTAKQYYMDQYKDLSKGK